MTIPFNNEKLEGHLDRIEGVRVLGWAWQSDLANDPIAVDLYVDDIQVSSVPASAYRPDLESAGKGNGRHAFELRLPESCFDGKSHSVRVCYQGTIVDLYGSPRPICLKLKTTSDSIHVQPKHIHTAEEQRKWSESKSTNERALGNGTITTLPNPRNAKVLPHFRLFAILGTWMEADIVGANIRNAITQGCERVYLVDNGSTDGTVEIARAEGAILARSFQTDRYDETLRLRHMNDVVAEISDSENDQHIWWLFLDSDEFPHGPWGLTLHEYLKTLDERFRIVGTRFFDHYPSGTPQYVVGRHPLDFQLLCEELAFPMCPSNHRKHPLQRYDRGGVPIVCGNGFHSARCGELLYEPTQPAFLHHFPFRQQEKTRQRLEALWTKDQSGAARALESRDTHMLARSRSFDAVYAHDWANVVNFITLDPMCSDLKSRPADVGVHPKPWPELVEAEHQHVLRWYSPISAWNYENVDKFFYGDDVTYRKGIAFLDGHGSIEDWGCGFAHARTFVTKSEYVGLDGSSKHADKIVDLRKYTSDADCLFMRHVLEHNFDWRHILANAIASFRKRMVLVIFTPLTETTRVIATSTDLTSIPVPDISFRKEDLTEYFKELKYSEESLQTDTQYQMEHVFYIEKTPFCEEEHARTRIAIPTQFDERLRGELDAWAAAGISAKFW